ncbi:hypothetical protein HDU97_005809 [Phlyctochytrium planicorne]|nr:hypothetical protein HDU97_005809 [Phlyctochytrium planicorne]
MASSDHVHWAADPPEVLHDNNIKTTLPGSPLHHLPSASDIVITNSNNSNSQEEEEEESMQKNNSSNNDDDDERGGPAFSYQQPLKGFDDDTSDGGAPHNPPSRDPNLLSASSQQHPSALLRRRSSLAGTSGLLKTDGPWWTDTTGRTVMLRGVNVSGSSKLPFSPKVPSHVEDGFFDDTNVSFVGRPFRLDEADEHFARLRRWGFNFLRFNVAWEALEHAGPGIYDYEFMDSIVALLTRAKHYGLRVFIDPHQDVWSRFSGGSGAPGWTLRAAGLDATKFKATEAAIVHNTYERKDNYPKMIWPTNYAKLACATMFTLFFGGETFAPKLMVDGVNIQTYLQDHYFNAFAELAKRIAAANVGLEDEVVIGYDTLNEPSSGYIGIKDLGVLNPEQDLKIGVTPTPLEGFKMGSGLRCDNVEVWELSWAGPRRKGLTNVDPAGVTCWTGEVGCVWANHGVWDKATGKLLKKDYFAKLPDSGKPVHFLDQFWRPFVHRFTDRIRAVHRTAVIFIEPPVNEPPPPWSAENGDPTYRIAYAPHWYDGLTLINKAFNRLYTVDVIGIKRHRYLAPPLALKFGDGAIRRCFRDQLETLRKEGLQHLGQTPCIMGEIGIPYDMDGGKAYRDHDWTDQTHALDVNMGALESNLISFTLWNYCSDHVNKWGDGWNGEDLSIFSREFESGKKGAQSRVGGTGGGELKSGEKKKKKRSGTDSTAAASTPPKSAHGELAVSAVESRKWSHAPSSSTADSREQSPTRSTDQLVEGRGEAGKGRKGRKWVDKAASGNGDVTVIEIDGGDAEVDEEDDEEDEDETTGEGEDVNGEVGTPLHAITAVAAGMGGLPRTPSASSLASSMSSSAAAAVAEARLTSDEDYLDVGGRSLKAFARPYPVLTPGTPLHLGFEMQGAVFTYTFCHPGEGGAGALASGRKRRRGFRHQYRRMYLVGGKRNSVSSLARPGLGTSGVDLNGVPATPTTPTVPASLGAPNAQNTVERRRSLLTLPTLPPLLSTPEYTRPTLTHTSMSPSVLATEVEIFLPRVHYPAPEEMEVWVSEGTVRVEPADMRLHWRCGCWDEEGVWVGGAGGHRGDVEHTIVLRRRGGGSAETIGELGRRRRREVVEELEGEGSGGAGGDERGGERCPGCEIM